MSCLQNPTCHSVHKCIRAYSSMCIHNFLFLFLLSSSHHNGPPLNDARYCIKQILPSFTQHKHAKERKSQQLSIVPDDFAEPFISYLLWLRWVVGTIHSTLSSRYHLQF